MLTIKRIKSYEIGLLFRRGEFVGLKEAGVHWIWAPNTLEVVSMRDVWLRHEQLDLIVKSGALAGRATVLDLRDNEKALVWIDGRFDRIVGRGLWVLWDTVRAVQTEVIDVRTLRLEHDELDTLLAMGQVSGLTSMIVPEGFVGLVWIDGVLQEQLSAGRYAYWSDVSRLTLKSIDLREQLLDVSGQELMTSDRVTLRLNVSVSWRVVDVVEALSASVDYKQALYREAQLALRAVVGQRTLDKLLEGKDAVATELSSILRERVVAFGLAIGSLGIRDVILPGDMKVLLNQVVEAKKAAEAAVITRREETAAMRSQANTAKLLEGNATLMRLKELEVLEKVAANSRLEVILGDQSLTEKVTKML